MSTAPTAAPTEGKKPRIALLVDYANANSRLSGMHGIPFCPARLRELARSLGRPQECLMCVDVRTVADSRLDEFHATGYTIVHCQRLAGGNRGKGKETVDQVIISLMYKLAEDPNVDMVLLMTADGDFLPSMNALRDAGKEVRVIVATPSDTNRLARHSNDVVAYAEEDESLVDLRLGSCDTRNPRALAVLSALEAIVTALAGPLRMNDHHWTFHNVATHLADCREVAAFCDRFDMLKEHVSFLKRSGIIAAAPGTHEDVTHYYLVHEHPYVQRVIAKRQAEITVHEPDNIDSLPLGPSSPPATLPFSIEALAASDHGAQ